MISAISAISAPAILATRSPDVVVVGAGVIGLAIARRLAAAGLRVVVCDRGFPATEATHAAAGMLCPRLEFPDESPLLALGTESLALFPDFGAELDAETGVDIDLRLGGVIAPLAADELSDATKREGSRRLDASELRRLEPALAPTIDTALLFEGEGSVDNRALARALIASCAARGVDVRAHCDVRAVLSRESRVLGVATTAGDLASCVVVNASGAWAGQLSGGGETVDVRPIKGQMLCFEPARSATDSAELAPLSRTIYSHDAYLVPRTDGRVIVGTTVEDRGFDKTVDPDAIAGLARRATKLVPALGRARIRESWAGLRPRGSRETPTVGARGHEGYYVAIGHFRNGILLTPWTAERLAREVLRRDRNA